MGISRSSTKPGCFCASKSWNADLSRSLISSTDGGFDSDNMLTIRAVWLAGWLAGWLAYKEKEKKKASVFLHKEKERLQMIEYCDLRLLMVRLT